jgi:hypothetical protein
MEFAVLASERIVAIHCGCNLKWPGMETLVHSKIQDKASRIAAAGGRPLGDLKVIWAHRLFVAPVWACGLAFRTGRNGDECRNRDINYRQQQYCCTGGLPLSEWRWDHNTIAAGQHKCWQQYDLFGLEYLHLSGGRF